MKLFSTIIIIFYNILFNFDELLGSIKDEY